MYFEFFRLREPPFSLTPDPRFLFMSERHREGLAHLLYGIQQPGGFVQLTGEVGSGKTTLCRCLVRQLPPETDIALILNPRLTVPELLASICDELRIPYPPESKSIKVLVDALNERLLAAHAQRRRTVLVIDEAQNLHPDVLEQIRLLTNLETSQEKLLQIILIGQPELLSILKRKELRQLAQRITARYHLLPLSRRETYGYVRHRLLVAGRSDPIFTSPAMSEVYRLSRGVPRLINVICDRALLGAYARDKQRIGAGIVRRAGRETRGIVPRFRRFRPASVIGLVAVVMLAVIGVAAFFIRANGPGSREEVAAITSPETRSREPGNHPGEASPNPEGKAAGVPGEGRGTSEFVAGPVEIAKTEATKDKAAGAADRSSAPTASRLADILADSSLRGTSITSFANLHESLGIKVSLDQSKLGCEAGRDQGYECLFRVGNWTRLRYFDLPAILELVLPSGQRHLVTLVGLGDETATLAIKDREYTFPLQEIDAFWDGSFIIVWQPPFASRLVSPGARGREVVWIRQAVDTIEGKTRSSDASDLYDETLRRRIMAFQRDQSLPQDGRVGNATLVRLVNALRGPNAPSLSRHAP